MRLKSSTSRWIPIEVLLVSLLGLGAGLLQAGEMLEESLEPPVKWHPTFFGEGNTGSRNYGSAGFTFPLTQDEASMLFFDFRARYDDDQDTEFNAGLAYRKILGDKIFGTYGFFDRHYADGSGNTFDQITLGAELLGEVWDHRFNGYIPTSLDGQGTGTGELSIVNNRLYISGLEERAYWGLDYEVGRLLRTFGENDNELRVYAGGFYFDNSATGYETIAGPRLRLEMRLFDLPLLGEGSRLSLSGEVQWDQVRETKGFAGVHLQIPLGREGRSERGKGRIGAHPSYSSMSRLERRMLDPIERDVDVVVNQSGQELANDAENDLLYVASSKYSTDDQIRNAGKNGTVIVNGTIETEGDHQLLKGQRLAGGNSVQTVEGATTGRRFTGKLPGDAGLLASSSTTSPVVLLTNSVTVEDLSVSGGSVGLMSTGSVNDVTIRNTDISGAAGSTFGLLNGSGIGIGGKFDGTITGNTLSNNASNGLYIEGANNGIISNNTTMSNLDDGINVGDNNGMIVGNTSLSDGDESIEVDGDNNGSIIGNTSRMAGEDGIQVVGTNFGEVSGNFVTMAGDDGFDFEDNEGVITNNMATKNGDDGIDLDGANYGTIRNNISKSNFSDGFEIEENEGLIAGNIATDNGESGIFLFDNYASGIIRNNTANYNGLDGFEIYGNEGLISGNTAIGNEFDGFFTFINFSTGIFRNNVANSNLEDGFDIVENEGSITGNTANLNSFSGFYLDINSGSITNNVANLNLEGFTVDETSGDMSGNSADSNTTFGFGAFALPNTDNTGTFDDNSSTNNGGAGYQVENNGAGTSSGNISSGNGAANTGGAVP